ncbi:hypothetical protein Tco_0105246 [Tanacetum coccineum]
MSTGKVARETCLNDLSHIPPNNEQNKPTQRDIGETSNEPTQAKRNKFEELYASANEELYPSCNFVTRLDFMAKFTHLKVKGKLNDSIFNEMLEFFQEVFPTRLGYKLPPSYYEIKKTFKTIELGWKDNNTTAKKVPKKVLRYFPIIPRIQRLYKSNHTTKQMTWHATGKSMVNGKMQHLVDGKAWKKFDTRDFFNDDLLILGPKSPGKDIDVYLKPLKDLLALKGVETIDAATSKTFNMRAMLLWTINDFPARSSLSGWSGQVVARPKQKQPHAKYSFTPDNGNKFCQFINGVKLPDRFGSNFKHKVTDNDSNITGMKSHDCHIMMQRLLSYGLQQYLDTDVAKPIIELCLFFKQIRSRTLMEDDMVKDESQLVDIMCNLGQIYPPTFFDIMIHLVIHLPQEALKGGPIPY